MSKEANKNRPFDQYIEGEEATNSFPFFYRYFEPYLDNISLDVEDVNLVHSEFHQSEAHAIGFFHKKASQVHLKSSDLIYKLQ